MTIKEFLKSKEPNTYIIPEDYLKEFALEIAEEAYEEGSFYQSGLNNEIKQNYLNKEQYLEKLKKEL